MKNKVRAMVLGFALGDAFGVPYEFNSRDLIRLLGEIIFRGNGTHHQPKGTWSDDTSLTLCLMESLCHGLDYRDIASKCLAWRDEAYLTASDYVFDIGITTSRSLDNLENNINPINSGVNDEFSNGNGSLMRVSPLCFYLINKDINDKREICFNVSSLTHGHHRSKIACWLYIEILINLINELNAEDAIDKAFSIVNHWLNGSPFQHEKADFGRCNSSIAQLDENEIRSSGYVIDTLEACLYTFLTENNYKNSIIKAVSLGDDTDTIAAITGSLAGLYYGFSEIPEEWLVHLKKKDEIIELCDSFTESLGF